MFSNNGKEMETNMIFRVQGQGDLGTPRVLRDPCHVAKQY